MQNVTTGETEKSLEGIALYHFLQLYMNLKSSQLKKEEGNTTSNVKNLENILDLLFYDRN